MAPRNQASNLEPPTFQTSSDGRIADHSNDEFEEPADADANIDRNMVDVINVSARAVRFEIHGAKYVLKPKQIVQLHRAYALPRKMAANRDPIPSVVELQTGRAVLACSDPRAAQAMAGLQG